MIIESSPVMIFYKDTENRFIHVNKSLADTVGLSKVRGGREILHGHFPRQAEGYWKDDKEVIASGRPKVGIIRANRNEKRNAVGTNRQGSLCG